MNMKEKIRYEIETLNGCEKECAESAYRAFESLLNDNHSGLTIRITQNILNRMIEGLPLSNIEGTDDEWSLVDGIRENCTVYKNKRMSGLFKYVYEDGRIEYSDVNRCVCFDVKNTKVSFTNGYVTSNIINQMFPIAMPYYPSTNKFRVYCEDFLSDPTNGDFDTIAVYYIITPNLERIEVNRYFKENANTFIEITEEEFNKRTGALNKTNEEG